MKPSEHCPEIFTRPSINYYNKGVREESGLKLKKKKISKLFLSQNVDILNRPTISLKYFSLVAECF